MTSAIDTNVILALWDAAESGHLAALSMLEAASARGGLSICGAVYGELLASPNRTVEFVEQFLRDGNIKVDWSSTETVWRTAGLAFQKYAARRRRQKSGDPRRILTDFYIGAHALCNDYKLLTLDDKIYRSVFPKLDIVGV